VCSLHQKKKKSKSIKSTGRSTKWDVGKEIIMSRVIDMVETVVVGKVWG
jgi:hypothetical protein